jgi:hypothetical protein
MKRRFLAAVVAVMMMATFATAETRVYQGVLESGGATDSLDGAIITVFPSAKTIRIKTNLTFKGGRFSISDLRIDGKKSKTRFACRRDTKKDTYFSRVVRCYGKERVKDILAEGKTCNVLVGISLSDDPYAPYNRYMPPLVVVTSIQQCSDYSTFRGWDNYVKRIL